MNVISFIHTDPHFVMRDQAAGGRRDSCQTPSRCLTAFVAAKARGRAPEILSLKNSFRLLSKCVMLKFALIEGKQQRI